MESVRCKRCGSRHVAWVQSKRTGRYYLAHRLELSKQVLAHRPHKCDEHNPICEKCGYRHWPGDFFGCEWRQGGGTVIENGQEILWEGEQGRSPERVAAGWAEMQAREARWGE